jgi:Putative Flp pilus-assembly TadE/G-like
MSPRPRCVPGVEGTRPRMAVAGGLVGKGGRARDGRRRGAGLVPGGSRGTEEGQALVLLIGLVVLVLMVLALGWDTSNWFLGHRALGNLADGAAVAAANDVDTRTWYRSGGRSVRVAEERARATVEGYLAGSVGDSGVAGVRLRSVQVLSGEGGPEVTVRVGAPARVGLLRLLRLVPPEMEGRAAATARLIPP